MCLNNPCLNNGKCVQTGSTSAVCQCPPSFTGFICDRANPCGQNPCLNNGTCNVNFDSATTSSYTCTCNAPFSGSNCQINSQCPLSCLNGGTCLLNYGNPYCSCQSGYSGSNCQTSTAPNVNCVDQGSFCPSVKSLCNSGLTVGGSTTLQTYCSLTCGICAINTVTTTTTPAPANCFDMASFCPNIISLCKSPVLVSGTTPINKYCAYTCGNCGSTQIIVNPTTTTTTTTQAPSNCVDNQDSCRSFASSCNVFLNSVVRVRDVCKKTCGNC